MSKPWEGQLVGLANAVGDQPARLDRSAPLVPQHTPGFAQPKRGAEPMRPVSILSAAANADEARTRVLSPRMQLVAKAAAANAAQHVRSVLHVRGVREAQLSARPSSAPVARRPSSSSHVPATARTAAEAAAAPAPAGGGAATARASSEHERVWRHKWRESEAARERRNAQLLARATVAQDKETIAATGRWSALRDLANERQRELLLLQSELQHLRTEAQADGGEGAALRARLAELEERAALAAAQAEEEEECTLCRQYMEARLRKRRPHLEKKLAFLRSELIVAAMQYHGQHEAMEVATAYEARMAERLAEEKERVDALRAANDERRNRLREELANQGSARRLRQIEAMNERAGPATEQVAAEAPQAPPDEAPQPEPSVQRISQPAPGPMPHRQSLGPMPAPATTLKTPATTRSEPAPAAPAPCRRAGDEPSAQSGGGGAARGELASRRRDGARRAARGRHVRGKRGAGGRAPLGEPRGGQHGAPDDEAAHRPARGGVGEAVRDRRHRVAQVGAA